MITESTIREALQAKAEDDGIIVRLTGTVIAQFEKLACHKFVYKADDKELFTTKGRHTVLHTVRRPVISVSKVEQRGLSDSTWTDLDVSLYYVDGARIESLAGFFSMHTRVTLTAGYTDGAGVGQIETPDDIKQALITQAQFLSTRMSGALVAQKQLVIGKASAALETADYHPLFVATAERYKHG